MKGLTFDCVSFSKVFLTNLSNSNPVSLNGKILEGKSKLVNKDVFTIIDRSFRFELPDHLRNSSPKKTPIKSPHKVCIYDLFLG